MLTHKGTDTLKTKRLILRPYLEGDGEAMYRNWASDPEVTRFLTWAPHESKEASEELVRNWALCYASPTCYHWVITLGGEPVGDISVVRWSEANEEAEIGYCLSRRLWGQGLMTEALSAVCLFLFDQVGFHRITLRHDRLNPASGRVMQKAGLLYEGCLREAMKTRDGRFADLCVYGGTRADFDTFQKERTQ